MNTQPTLADRMKEYEFVWDQKLTGRMPIILRLDGNSFSNFTKLAGFEKPFDKELSEIMVSSAIKVLQYCSGSTFAFVQSDEISILLRNDQTVRTQAFLANRIQKLVSLTSSIVTGAFYKSYLDWVLWSHTQTIIADDQESMPKYGKRKELVPAFDCRAFILPRKEVCNYFIWRQRDAYKNAVSSVALEVLIEKHSKSEARKLLSNQNTEQRKKILLEYGVDIDSNIDATLGNRFLYGVSIRKTQIQKQLGDLLLGKIPDHVDVKEEVTRTMWAADYKAPDFTKHRSYIEDLL